MGDIFRNKFFIIFLITACFLTILTIGLNIAGYGNLVSDVVSMIIQPFQTFANMVSSSVSGFVGYFTVFNELREENAALRARVQELESEVVAARAVQERNRMLSDFFGLKEERPDFSFRDASVIARSAGNYTSEFTISRGAFHGVERNMPVIASGGGVPSVVGYISRVGLRYAHVSPFIRPQNFIGAYIKRTGYTGNVEGGFELGKDGLARMTELAREAEIEVGDRVYSSGYGGMYPEDLFIGTVLEIYADPLLQTLEAIIQPGINFDQIRDVMVILEFKWIFG